MEKLVAIPLVGVGDVRFGMTREEVRRIFGYAKEFKKSPFSKTTTDDFGFCHVYYDADNKCEAIEIFDGAEVKVAGKVVFPGSIRKIKSVIGGLVKDDCGYTSASYSTGVFASGRKIESILFAGSGYYE